MIGEHWLKGYTIWLICCYHAEYGHLTCAKGVGQISLGGEWNGHGLSHGDVEGVELADMTYDPAKYPLPAQELGLGQGSKGEVVLSLK